MDNLECSITDDIMYIYNVTPENVHKIEIPEQIDELRIYGDYLDHFSVPDGIKSIHIDSMGLKTLKLHESLESLHCSKNFLRTLEIPASLTVLEARDNLLTRLKVIGFNLEFVDIRSNRFKSLDFPISPKIEYFNASFNDNIEYISPQIKLIIESQDIQISPRAKTPDNEDCEFRYIKSI